MKMEVLNNFNTSHVNVNRKPSLNGTPPIPISIHLMLMLITKGAEDGKATIKFQYISC